MAQIYWPFSFTTRDANMRIVRRWRCGDPFCAAAHRWPFTAWLCASLGLSWI